MIYEDFNDNGIIEEVAFSAFVSDQTSREFPIISNKFNMNKITKVLKSRTVWTLIVLFLVNGVSGIHGLIPASLLPVVDGLLGILTVYFHVNPSQNYSS